MHFLDWKYAGMDELPTIEYLKYFSVREMVGCINAAVKHKTNCTTECGGFRIEVDLEGDPYIKMSFVLSSWCSGD